MILASISALFTGSVPVLAEAAARSLAVALAVWAGLRLLRVSHVLAQKAVWSLVLLAALLMPLAMRWQGMPSWVAIRVPAWAHSVSTAPLPQVQPAQFVVPPGPGRMASGPADRTAADRLPAPPLEQTKFNLPVPAATVFAPGQPSSAVAVSAPRVGWRVLSLATLAGLLYLAVCAALLTRLFFGLGLALRLWWTAQPVLFPRGFGPAAGLAVRQSSRVASPVTIGSGVVLPTDYAEWDLGKLRVVLAHERSHIRQGDFYLQLAAGLYAALFWFSPLGWWLKRQLAVLGETIGDRAALDEAPSCTSYLQILLEFAALPRPTLIGVAMARTSTLSHRIERLLNESSFRQAFAGSRRRAFAAVLLVPAALFASTALVRVEASGQVAQTAPAQTSVTGQSTPDQVPPVADVPATPETLTDAELSSAPEPSAASTGDNKGSNTIVVNGKGHSLTVLQAKEQGFVSDEDSYAIVAGSGNPGSGNHIFFYGNGKGNLGAEIDKARHLAQVHGNFLWFMHGGKSYVLTDPVVVAQFEAMYKPMEALGREQEELGRQQEVLAHQQETLGRLQEQTSVRTPDISKEMAELNAAAAKLQALKAQTVSQEQLADLESKLAGLEGKLGALEGNLGTKQGILGAQQGKLGAQQGKLGEAQGRLGSEQARLAQDAERKVKSIIDESLRDGKARPVE